jgi:hypothetical protein
MERMMSSLHDMPDPRRELLLEVKKRYANASFLIWLRDNYETLQHGDLAWRIKTLRNVVNAST